MNSQESHELYFSQYATSNIVNYVSRQFSKRQIDILRHELAQNNNRALCMISSVPLRQWDDMEYAIRRMVDTDLMKQNKEFFSLSFCVCVAKEAMRQYLENSK